MRHVGLQLGAVEGEDRGVACTRIFLRLSRIFSTSFSGNGLSVSPPPERLARVAFNEPPGMHFSKSIKPFFNDFLSLTATRDSCNLLRSTGHRPGDGRPAPSTKSRADPFRYGLRASPLPHQPSPSFGRRVPGSSLSSSGVLAMSSASFGSRSVGSWVPSSDNASWTSPSIPSRMGLPTPLRSASSDALSTTS